MKKEIGSGIQDFKLRIRFQGKGVPDPQRLRWLSLSNEETNAKDPGVFPGPFVLRLIPHASGKQSFLF